MVSLLWIVALKVIVDKGEGFAESIVICTTVGSARTVETDVEMNRNTKAMSNLLVLTLTRI